MRPIGVHLPARAFTLIELLVVIAIIGVLVGVLLPLLGASRAAARAAACASNLRQIELIARTYADQFKGLGPALGAPYASIPNWAMLVQQDAGVAAVGTAAYAPASVLVCPAARTINGRVMTRTYAINATGLAGLAGDRSNYDVVQTHARVDAIEAPGETIALVDSGVAPAASNAPPSDRTSSVLDFRQPRHLAERVARPHDAGRSLNAALHDGSVRPLREPTPMWARPLP